MFELSKAVVYELPDPGVYNHPPGVEQLVTRAVVEQLVRGRHYFKRGAQNPKMAQTWSDFGPPTSGQVHWG